MYVCAAAPVNALSESKASYKYQSLTRYFVVSQLVRVQISLYAHLYIPRYFVVTAFREHVAKRSAGQPGCTLPYLAYQTTGTALDLVQHFTARSLLQHANTARLSRLAWLPAVALCTKLPFAPCRALATSDQRTTGPDQRL
eukprot:23031-Pleurochrysis_carterae.AAC.3